MAGSLNKVMLIGNLGSDPEVKNLGNGKSVANFRIATSEQWKDRDGEKQEKTEWHSIQIWNEKLIEVVEKYLSKGDKVYVEGKIQTRKWEDQDGKDRYSTEVVVDKLTMLVTKGNNADDRGGSSRSRRDDDRGETRSAGRSSARGRDDDRTSDRGGRSRDDDDRGGRTTSRGRGDDRDFGSNSGGGSRRAQARNADMDDDIPF